MINFLGKHIESAIFDMDGTMFDTERLRFQTIRQASLELAGRPIEDRTLIGSLGLSATRAEALAKEHYGEDYPYREIRRRADELELQHVRTHGVPIKIGLLQVLERLRRSGLTMAVATSSRRSIAEEYLINANVLKYFDITVCGDEVQRGKPHPEIFLRAATELNRLPERCLMVEDSENGLLSASDAGGQPILIHDIKAPRAEIEARAFKAYGGMLEFLSDLADCVPKLDVPAVTDPFPQAINQMRAGIHGFGAIGGGYLTQVFSHWDGYTRPCEIIGVTGDQLLRDAVNAFGKFSVRYGKHAFDQTIDHVRLIHMGDEDGIMAMYCDSLIVGLALPEQAIRQQAPIVARGLLRRYEQGRGELTILVVLNKVGGASYVRRHVEAALLELTTELECAKILAATHFSETVVSRIVTRLGRESLQRQLRIKCELFEKNLAAVHSARQDSADEPALDLDPHVSVLRNASAPARALSQLHLILFNSEPDMLLYAQGGGSVLRHLRQVKTVADIAQIQTIKNRLWNGTHAIVAWYASLLGYSTIGRGMGDERVMALVRQLIENEIEPALLLESPQLEAIIKMLMRPFIERCRSSFKDPCKRVGRDPLRKLRRRERILGSLALARKHGIPTPGLEFAIALAIRYALSDAAEGDLECELIRSIYARESCPKAVLTYRGNYHGHPYQGLDPIADATSIAAIADHFEKLADPEGRHWQWPLDLAAGSARGGRTISRTVATAALESCS
ncbi:bifunctional mannitol-1-phosphate dehydrogenase/phosphatase [Steroidobacter agaridevorans]|uniref:bifunctional mannitol-1-phosphate dehydrogenase/phosphatase n=1 Tax=Steroidobacter agaridevorans TaxID=2695856 RepID=UPI001325D628|nr:HAD family hydrolase [Steroidobacter agaridevorans]GFE87385.1 haloacid dehalogenase [Steroidobacter agaridevorans]